MCRSVAQKKGEGIVSKKKEIKHKDISRIDQVVKRTHGYYVRVRHLGVTHSKFFSDGKHGGRKQCLREAVKGRNAIEKRIGKQRTDRHIVCVSNTPTGVVGVRLVEHLNRYEVSWVQANGRQGKTSVSIRKHGKEAAFARACEIREKKNSERIAA